MKHIVFLLSFLVVAAFANAQQSDDTKPDIKFDKVVHDYGTIYQNADGNCVFTFTNTGKTPLVLTNVRSSCGCTVPKWPREPVLPGESATIKVKYDTRRLGVINKQITVSSNAKTSTVILKIKGLIKQKPAETLPEKNVNAEGSPVAR